MFVDEIEIEVHAGDGGNGCIAFLREKYRPKGGPAGGDGGRGGNVFIKVDKGLLTLQDLKGKRVYKAKRGKDGGTKEKRGANGENIVIPVPPGTLVMDSETNETIVDLDEDSQPFLIAKGGDGGLGNVHFATSVTQTPRKATSGKPGEIKTLRLELRVIADIGLIGLPSAGKSSLVALVSTADPKQADYPFTTLIPQIGHITISDVYRVTIADLPGLIEDAHEGRGLGHRFLKHVKRTRAFIHLIEWRDAYAENPKEFKKDLNIIINEIKEFDEAILEKTRFTVLNKIDLMEPSIDKQKIIKKLRKESGSEFFYAISVRSHDGVEELISDIAKVVLKSKGRLIEELPPKFMLPKDEKED